MPLGVTKQLRQLESSDIRLNEIAVALHTEFPRGVHSHRALDKFAEKVSTLIDLEKAVVPFDDYLLQLPVKRRPLARRVYAVIDAAGVFGATAEDLMVRIR